MTNTTTTTSNYLDTHHLAVGDVILNHGMRIRLVAETARRYDAHTGRTVVGLLGIVENIDEIDDVWVVGMARAERDLQVRRHPELLADAEAAWYVQGNELAHWNVIELAPR